MSCNHFATHDCEVLLSQHSYRKRAAIGVRAWDVQARIILRVGPLDTAAFVALLPDRSALRALVSLIRAYVGYETGFAINPVLAATAVPPLQLGPQADPLARLGWTRPAR